MAPYDRPHVMEGVVGILLTARWLLDARERCYVGEHVLAVPTNWPPESSNNEDKDAWLMKIELKRDEPEEINKDEGIKKAMEVQAPVVKEEGIPQPLPNLFTPTEIEAFKIIELAHIQNKYVTQENILLKDHIAGLKGIIRKLEELLRSMCDYPPPPSPSRT